MSVEKLSVLSTKNILHPVMSESEPRESGGIKYSYDPHT